MDDDEVPAEIDFSGGVRGSSIGRMGGSNLPVHLEADVQDYLVALAAKKGIALSDLASDLLKKDIAVLEAKK
jgi:hypothetical protein